MKFGQYELLEQIAVGGMAEVFKGRVVAAEGFEKLVAIKRILPDLAEDDRFVKMLLTEARIHSALSHRNIVQIHDLGISEDGEYFIVLEYVEGYDLRVIMEQIHGAGEIIPEALSLHIAAEIAQALNFAHELRGPDGQALGLVHRDVTPSNILISFAGEVKLSDFGLAKRRHDRSVVGSLKGNLAYMSPEQAKQAELDRRTDIFSLGAILFELLTGKRLREITDEVAGWNQVASGVLPSARQVRPDLPAPVEHLLDGALAVDPAKRFPDAATFGAAIRDVLGDLSVAVGASDLAALLGVVTPPRRARTIMMERSKVIRLGPEAQALKEAIAAPATPAPVPTSGKRVRLADPGPTPPPATRGAQPHPRPHARGAQPHPRPHPRRETQLHPRPHPRRAQPHPRPHPRGARTRIAPPGAGSAGDAAAGKAAAAGARARLHTVQGLRPGAHAARHAAAAARRRAHPTDDHDRPRHRPTARTRPRSSGRSRAPRSRPCAAPRPRPRAGRRNRRPRCRRTLPSRRRRARARAAHKMPSWPRRPRTGCSARRLRTSRTRGRFRRRAACHRAACPAAVFEPRASRDGARAVPATTAVGRRVRGARAAAGGRGRRRPPLGDPARRAHHLGPADRPRDHDRSGGRSPAPRRRPAGDQRADDGFGLARSRRARRRSDASRLSDRAPDDPLRQGGVAVGEAEPATRQRARSAGGAVARRA